MNIYFGTLAAKSSKKSAPCAKSVTPVRRIAADSHHVSCSHKTDKRWRQKIFRASRAVILSFSSAVFRLQVPPRIFNNRRVYLFYNVQGLRDKELISTEVASYGMKVQTNKNRIFPLRVASIDTGSNGIRFEAAEFASPDAWQSLASERIPVRLSKSVFISGRVESKAMDAAASAFRAFAPRMKELHVRHYRAVATSAVRESSNGEQFARRIAKETGISLRIITGSEEARYAHRAVRHPVGFRMIVSV